jgi:LDH2 family malate/lactate/ureidoglycolate dehydrogenase
MRRVRHDLLDLQRFATELLTGAGLDADKAQTVARLLVAADAMGHTTHGLAQLADYLAQLESGAMETRGAPAVVSDHGAAVVWDGRRLPGVWLAHRAVALASERAAALGLCAISIRRSHHIGCLAALLPYATERGLLVIVACSDPSAAMVAPFGGRGGVFTPDPIAVGIPTAGEPILIDMSASITTAAMSARLRSRGERFPGAWALDAEGRATDDPGVLAADLPGALLPAGGLDHGQKGYGLALMVEALTQGLSAHGRADGETAWGASVFVQVFDPALFGGREAFTRQADFIAALCRASPPLDPNQPVRLPGEAALRSLRAAETAGVPLYPGILESLAEAMARYGVTGPRLAGETAGE